MEASKDTGKICSRFLVVFKEECEVKTLELRDVRMEQKITEQWEGYMNSAIDGTNA